MVAWRRGFALVIEDEDLAKLRTIARSRTEPASRVERAQMLLAYRDDLSYFAVARALGLHHQTVQRCIERAVAYGPMAALEDLPRPGKEPTITAEAKAWLVSLACKKSSRIRLSARAVDDTVAGRSCAGVRTGRRTSVPGQACTGYGMQNP